MTFQAEIDKRIKDGSIYFVGDALPPDWYAAFKLWSELAKNGDPKAQLNVGWCYVHGEGTAKSLDQGLNWLHRAAAANCPKAFWHLYENDVESSDLIRKDYLEKASNFGSKVALEKIEQNNTLVATAAKKAADDALKQQMEIAQTAENNRRSTIAIEIVELCNAEKYEMAKNRCDELIASGETWLEEARASFDIQLELVVRKNEVDSPITSTVNKSSVINYSFKNPSSVDIRNVALVCRVVGHDEHFLDDDIYQINAGATVSKVHIHSSNKNLYILPFLYVHPFGKNTGYHRLRLPIKGAKKTLVPSGGEFPQKNGCFVLTVCYGNADHPVVKSFRSFRDNSLSKSKHGRFLTRFYYKYGPFAANYVAKRPALSSCLRFVFSRIEKFLPR
ncbi:MAG: tetratricopeptide repeat protein [Acidovorax sp.]|nr:tetratricopeptide repeat protein [Acidovorax sp.]